MAKKQTKEKICSRGHHYEGSGPCPVCWPGRHKKLENVHIAFLRGINVGGKSLIKMADLKEAAEACGLKNVRTFIQSGNIIFEAKGSSSTLTKKLEKALSKAFGIDIRVVVKTKKELEAILKKVPHSWLKGHDVRCYMAFVCHPKTAQDIIEEAKPKEGVDTIKAGDGVVYMTTKLSGITKSGFSKLASKAIYKYITIRNYSTVQKILDLMNKEE